MSKIFISYSRCDLEQVKSLVEDLRALGHEVWYDRELTGGQKWWDKILNQICKCSTFIFVISAQSVKSEVCSLELSYAEKVNRNILPVKISHDIDLRSLPTILQSIHVVDYSSQDRDSIIKLVRSLETLPTPQPLPDPLPRRPDISIPSSPIGNLEYDSSVECPPFKSWTLYCSTGELGIQFVDQGDDDTPYVLLNAEKHQSVGVNLSVPIRKGRVTFRYKVVATNTFGSHLYMAMIPM
jgi:hypothetical protein